MAGLYLFQFFIGQCTNLVSKTCHCIHLTGIKIVMKHVACAPMPIFAAIRIPKLLPKVKMRTVLLHAKHVGFISFIVIGHIIKST